MSSALCMSLPVPELPLLAERQLDHRAARRPVHTRWAERVFSREGQPPTLSLLDNYQAGIPEVAHIQVSFKAFFLLLPNFERLGPAQNNALGLFLCAFEREVRPSAINSIWW